MVYVSDFMTASNLAVLGLTFFGGLVCSYFFTSKGVRGCITYAVSLGFIVFLAAALVTGYSVYLERATNTLANYIYYNAIGVVGFLVGFVLGIVLRK